MTGISVLTPSDDKEALRKSIRICSVRPTPAGRFPMYKRLAFLVSCRSLACFMALAEVALPVPGSNGCCAPSAAARTAVAAAAAVNSSPALLSVGALPAASGTAGTATLEVELGSGGGSDDCVVVSDRIGVRATTCTGSTE